jgi:hypothetical protein
MMDCPHCGYKDGWDGDLMEVVRGEHGDFFRATNQIEMQRQDARFWRTETRTLLGCPACTKVFMGD